MKGNSQAPEPLTSTAAKRLETLAACLHKFDDNLAFARSERFMGTLRWPCLMRLYIPMLKWVNKDHKGLPEEELKAVRQSIRTAARTLWTLSLAVGEAERLICMSSWLAASVSQPARGSL